MVLNMLIYLGKFMAILILIVALAPLFIAEIGRWLIDLFPPSLGRPVVPRLKVGDRIIYSKTKFSMHPTVRARHMFPSEHGEDYSYVVDKYWVVADVLADGRLVAKTRRGKLHHLRPTDANLRKAPLVELVFHHDKFPDLALAA